MRDLLLMFTKCVHFTFENETYVQLDGVAMGSPLGPVIAGIFMVELETTLVPLLSNHMSWWRRYVDDTFCIIKEVRRIRFFRYSTTSIQKSNLPTRNKGTT